MGRIIRSVLGVVVGLAIAIGLIAVCDRISSLMFPVPEGTNIYDMEQMKAYIAGLPTIALVLYLVYHGIATLCGAFVAPGSRGGRTSLMPWSSELCRWPVGSLHLSTSRTQPGSSHRRWPCIP